MSASAAQGGDKKNYPECHSTLKTGPATAHKSSGSAFHAGPACGNADSVSYIIALRHSDHRRLHFSEYLYRRLWHVRLNLRRDAPSGVYLDFLPRGMVAMLGW